MFGYLIAIVAPPIPMFQQGRVWASLVTLLLMLTIVGWPIASFVAVMQTRATHITDKRTRRVTPTVVAALALALALPAQAFAVEATGSTSESLSGPAAAVSLTVPASVTYSAPAAGKHSATVAISNLTTNNPTGMTVSVVASNWTGSGSVPASTTRSRNATPTNSSFTGTPARAVGFYTGSNSDLLATFAAAQPTATGFSLVMHAESAPFSVVNGTYSGSLAFTAVTNP